MPDLKSVWKLELLFSSMLLLFNFHSLCTSEIGRDKLGPAIETDVVSFPGSCVGEEEHCSRMHQIPLVTCILLRYTKITVNFWLPAESSTA